MDDSYQQLDQFLRFLVDLINKTDVEIGITLTTGGATITGTAVAWREFFQGSADSIRQQTDDLQEQSVAGALADIFETEASFDRELHSESPPGEPQFIHLRNAQILSGQALYPSQGGMWWRVRLSEIDGFSIGRLSILG